MSKVKYYTLDKILEHKVPNFKDSYIGKIGSWVGQKIEYNIIPKIETDTLVNFNISKNFELYTCLQLYIYSLSLQSVQFIQTLQLVHFTQLKQSTQCLLCIHHLQFTQSIHFQLSSNSISPSNLFT